MSDATAILPAGPPAAGCCAPATRRDTALDAARLAELARALAEPVRVELVDVLRRHGEPLCQCELIPLFDIPQSTLSHHLKKLADAGVVTVERRHRWAYYTIAPEALKELKRWLS